MAKAGWDVLIGRDDIEAVGYEPYITMPDLQARAEGHATASRSR